MKPVITDINGIGPVAADALAGQPDLLLTAVVELDPGIRVPVIVDHDPEGGGDPVSVFESGAILLYLADKTGRRPNREAGLL